MSGEYLWTAFKSPDPNYLENGGLLRRCRFKIGSKPDKSCLNTADWETVVGPPKSGTCSVGDSAL